MIYYIQKKKGDLKITTEEKYIEKYQQYCKGEISQEKWYEFCAFVLDFLMEENKDILKTLKEIW